MAVEKGDSMVGMKVGSMEMQMVVPTEPEQAEEKAGMRAAVMDVMLGYK